MTTTVPDNSNLPPIVFVVWEDATTRDAGPWSQDEDHSYQPKLFTQVGFLLNDAPEGIVLSCAYGADAVATRDQIPRGMIRHIEYLKPKLKAPKRRKTTE